MKAAILTQLNSPLEVVDLQLTELKIGQVRVKITKSGLCGAQLQEIAGLKGNEKFLPHLMGHEGCGYVEEIGPGVTKVKPNDKVILHWRKANGIESGFPTYLWNDKNINGGKVTTLSEYSIVSENRVTKVNSEVSDDFCALMGCGLSTGLSVVNKEANVKFGESVLILGAGGVGLNCILAATLSNAFPVAAIDINLNKKELVEKNGGKVFTITQFNECLEFLSHIDCIIDTTGDLNLVSKFLPHLSERGRCIFVSQPKQNSSLQILNPIKFFNTNGIQLKTTQAGNFDPDTDIPRYTKLFLNGKINTENVITNYFSLNNINDAISLLKEGNSGRIMINI